MAYFSNSTEGSILDEQCADCPFGCGWNDPNQKELFDVDRQPNNPCPTATIQLLYNYDQLKDGNGDLKDAMEILVDKDGVCQTRKLLLEIREREEVDTESEDAY